MSNLEFIERLKKVAGVNEDQELAEIFKMSKANFSYAKKNGSFSFGTISAFAAQYDCDLNWLITGKERKPELDEMEQGLLTRFRALDFEGKLAVLNAANNKSAVGLGGVSQNANGNVGNMVGGNQTGSQRVQIFDLNEDD